VVSKFCGATPINPELVIISIKDPTSAEYYKMKRAKGEERMLRSIPQN